MAIASDPTQALPAGDAAPAASSPPAASSIPAPTSARYAAFASHAKGGLGEVFRATDTELNRTVALKRLQPRHADRAESRRRFLIEAEVTAQLEHPGIVPVYGLVRDEAGQPCYAMRFIEGQTLAEAIQQFHEQPGSFAARPLEFRQLLGRLVAVCNAVGYAHSRSVIHRDLKPQNILLGAFGETLLVDWGMAKRLTPPPDGASAAADPQLSALPATQEFRSPSPDFADETQPGSVLGTPAYMSPEQAAGRTDAIGPAADIYSLGATLYMLLTGKPAFEGGDWPKLQQQIQRGQFLRPRELKPAAPKPLEAICLKAMAAEPEQRYGSAAALAADLERWLAGEPTEAFKEPLHWRAGRWAKANARVLLMLAAMAAIGALAYWDRRHAKTQFEAIAENAFLRSKGHQERGRWSEALATVKQIALPGDFADAEWSLRLRQQRLDLETALALEELRRQGAVQVGLMVDGSGQGVLDSRFRKAFAAVGIDLDALAPEEAAARIRASAIREQLIEGLDVWSFAVRIEALLSDASREQERWLRLVRTAEAADDSPWRKKLRKSLTQLRWNDAAQLAQATLAEMDANAGKTAIGPTYLAMVAMMVEISETLNKAQGNLAERLLLRSLELHPRDFVLHCQLASYYAAGPKADPARALAEYRVAHALDPENLQALLHMADLLEESGAPEEALLRAEQALRIDASPRRAWVAKARAHLALQQPRAAIAAAETALTKDGKWSGESAAVPHLLMGRAATDLGDHQKAAAAFAKAVEAEENSTEAHYRLGLAFLRMGRAKEADQHYEKASRTLKGDASLEEEYGFALLKLGKPQEAYERFARAVGLRPEEPRFRADLAVALIAIGRPEEAKTAFNTALLINPKFSPAHAGLGELLLAQKKHAEAVAAWEKALQFDPKNSSYAAKLEAARKELAKAQGGKEAK